MAGQTSRKQPSSGEPVSDAQMVFTFVFVALFTTLVLLAKRLDIPPFDQGPAWPEPIWWLWVATAAGIDVFVLAGLWLEVADGLRDARQANA